MKAPLAAFDCLAEDVGVQSVVVPELELRDVQRKILVTDLVEVAHNAALDERPETLDCVRMNRADDMLTFGVIDGLVREPMLQSVIAVVGVSAKEADAGRDGFADEALQGRTVSAVDDTGDDVPLAPDCANDSGLERVARTASFPAFLVPMAVLVVPSDVGFVNLDDAAELLNVLNEGDADFVAHEPSGLIGTEAHITVDLERGHSLFADQHQMNYAIPVFQRLVCVLKDRAGQMREAVAFIRASVALPLPIHRRDGIDTLGTATRATGAFRPTARNEILDAIVLSPKQRVELRCGQLINGLGFPLLPAGHGSAPGLSVGSL
jgi:hypothetical protein